MPVDRSQITVEGLNDPEFVAQCKMHSYAPMDRISRSLSNPDVAAAFPSSAAFKALSESAWHYPLRVLSRAVEFHIPLENRAAFAAQYYLSAYYQLVTDNRWYGGYILSVINNLPREHMRTFIGDFLKGNEQFIAHKKSQPQAAKWLFFLCAGRQAEIDLRDFEKKNRNGPIEDNKAVNEQEVFVSPQFAQMVEHATIFASMYLKNVYRWRHIGRLSLKSNLAFAVPLEATSGPELDLLMIFFRNASNPELQNAQGKKEATVYCDAYKGETPAFFAELWHRNPGPTSESRQKSAMPRAHALTVLVSTFRAAVADESLAATTREASQEALNAMKQAIGKDRPDLFPVPAYA